MRSSAALAREYGVHLHTHLAETLDEDRFCREKFGYSPVDLMSLLNWTGEDVWFAHCVHVDAQGIKVFSSTGCGVAHCPTSNMRLASGIAPLWEYLHAGIKIGLGVDGSASNDGSHMLSEARQAMLLARVRAGLMGASNSSNESTPLITARQVLELATLGGASILGRDDLGALAVGRCADFTAFRLDRLEYAGGLHDPVAALVFCSPVHADFTIVNGKIIVEQGQMVTVDTPKLIETHNKAAHRLLQAC
jgi:cytosine/adenosine deaminase-related metal-dependent hydrolase